MKTGEKCVLCVKHFFHKGEMESSSFSSTLSWISTPLLYSSATDGHISIWDLVPFLWDHFSPPVTADARASQHSPVRFKVHQSGVNSMDVCLISPPDCYLFLSGGDDNALAVTCLGIGSEGVYDTNGDGGGSHGNGASGKTGLTANVLWQLLEPAAHSSALTGMILSRVGVCVCVCVLCLQGIEYPMNLVNSMMNEFHTSEYNVRTRKLDCSYCGKFVCYVYRDNVNN